MENIISTLTNNPAYLAGAVILSLIILYGAIKKLIKLALVVFAILVLFIAYWNWTGQDIPLSIDEFQDSIQGSIEKGKDRLNEAGERMKEKSADEFKKAVDEKVKDLIEE